MSDKKKRLIPDAEKFLIELTAVSSVGCVVSLGWDIAPNLLFHLGVSSTAHPIGFGVFQLMGVLFFGTMLYRAWTYSKYYF